MIYMSDDDDGNPVRNRTCDQLLLHSVYWPIIYPIKTYKAYKKQT